MAKSPSRKNVSPQAGSATPHRVSQPKGPKKPVPSTNPIGGGDSGIRLNKYIANAGICTRREADIYIEAGAVWVNNKPVTQLGYKVQPGDEVKFDGKIITPEKKEYYLLNKPKGFDLSTKAENFEKSALSLMASASKYRLFPVGGMHRSYTGLLLFTNDHDFIKKYTDSGLLVRKIFQVTLDKNLLYEDFVKIQEGVFVDQKKVLVDEISYIENAPKNQIGLELRSNRQNIVTRLFRELGYEVKALDRVSYAGLTKKDLPRGRWRPLTKQEIINLVNLNNKKKKS